jgi:hypothetical protein
MDGDTLYSIGDLTRRTGLTVKAIRFHSDSGIVAPTDRSPAGYRLSASLPPSTIRYSSRIGVPSKNASKISRAPAA